MKCSTGNILRLAALLLSLPLGGCHLLLVVPCGFGCDTWLTSLPPRDSVMALALGGDPAAIEQTLTAAAQVQYATLERKWPAALDCLALAQPGCRYTLPVQTRHRDGLKVEAGECAYLDVVVEETGDGPVVRRTGYRPMRCPELPSSKAGSLR